MQYRRTLPLLLMLLAIALPAPLSAQRVKAKKSAAAKKAPRAKSGTTRPRNARAVQGKRVNRVGATRKKAGKTTRRLGATRNKARGSKSVARTKPTAPKKATARKRRVRSSAMTDEQAAAAAELNKLLERPTAEQLRDKAFEPDYSTIDSDKRADLPPAKKGHIRIASGKQVRIRSKRAKNAFRALKRNKRLARRRAKNPRRVVISGGGPTGTLSAIQAYRLGLDVTIVEGRTANTLPIVWNNRQQSRDILHLIDPALESRLFKGRKVGRLRSGEFIEDGKSPVVSKPKLRKAGDPATVSNHAAGIGASPSVWQSQARVEVEQYWKHLHELEKAEAKLAKKEGRKPRLTILRGYRVVDLPSRKGNKRAVVVQEMKDVLQKGTDPKNPVLNGRGKPIRKAYKEGDPIPEGWSKVKVGGKKRTIRAPDDVLIAEGANSSTRKLAGAKSVDVGPNTRFIAGYLEGVSFKALPDAKGSGAGQGGVVRRGFRELGNGVALRQIALSPSNRKGVWALPEVDPRLDFDSPASIKKYFGRSMSRAEAVKTYYVREIAPLVGVKPKELEGAFSFGPGDFVLQSHVSGPPAKDATNVHLVGDARGNSHFLTSLGKVTGSGTHQLSLRHYWEALKGGANEKLAKAILDRRLDAGTRAWLKLGLREFTTSDGTNLGQAAVQRARSKGGKSTFKSNSTRQKYDASKDPTVSP